jgi:serine/threonine protein kinase
MSLGRRVALKVLPFAGALDARRLQRFRIKAQAAAQLQHTYIVPVYFVGSERGVHYYAMQFIEGHSLAKVIADLRAGGQQPSASLPEETVDVACGKPVPAAHAAATPAAAALSTLRCSKDPAFFRAVARLGIQAAEALDHAHQHGYAAGAGGQCLGRQVIGVMF